MQMFRQPAKLASYPNNKEGGLRISIVLEHWIQYRGVMIKPGLTCSGVQCFHSSGWSDLRHPSGNHDLFRDPLGQADRQRDGSSAIQLGFYRNPCWISNFSLLVDNISGGGRSCNNRKNANCCCDGKYHDVDQFRTFNGLFYVDQEALRGSIEAKLAVSPLYLSSIGSLSFPFLSTHHCFGVFYMIRTIRSFPTHRPCISVYISSFQRWSQFSVSIPCFRARFTA